MIGDCRKLHISAALALPSPPPPYSASAPPQVPQQYWDEPSPAPKLKSLPLGAASGAHPSTQWQQPGTPTHDSVMLLGGAGLGLPDDLDDVFASMSLLRRRGGEGGRMEGEGGLACNQQLPGESACSCMLAPTLFIPPDSTPSPGTTDDQHPTTSGAVVGNSDSSLMTPPRPAVPPAPASSFTTPTAVMPSSRQGSTTKQVGRGYSYSPPPLASCRQGSAAKQVGRGFAFLPAFPGHCKGTAKCDRSIKSTMRLLDS